LKREVSQLKSLSVPPHLAPELTSSAREAGDGSSLCNPSSCGFGRHERKVLAKLEEDVAGLLSVNSEHDLKCLKHEVRLLKAHASGLDIVESPPSHILDTHLELIHQLEEKLAALSVMVSRLSADDLRHDVKCMKFELKRLFGMTPEGVVGGQSPGIENLISFLVNLVKKEVKGELQNICHVLTTAGSHGHVEESQGQLCLAGTSTRIAQVVVDLPQASSVQLVFRSPHGQ
jgi:hypothetical protein